MKKKMILCLSVSAFLLTFSCNDKLEENSNITNKPVNEQVFTPQEVGVWHNKLLKAYYAPNIKKHNGEENSESQENYISSYEQFDSFVSDMTSTFISEVNNKEGISEEMNAQEAIFLYNINRNFALTYNESGKDEAIEYYLNAAIDNKLLGDAAMSKSVMEQIKPTMLDGNITELTNILKSLKNNITVKSNDIYAIESFIEVYKNSSAYWNESTQTKISSNGKVIIADAVGGVLGTLMGGIWGPVVAGCASLQMDAIEEAEKNKQKAKENPNYTIAVDNKAINSDHNHVQINYHYNDGGNIEISQIQIENSNNEYATVYEGYTFYIDVYGAFILTKLREENSTRPSDQEEIPVDDSIRFPKYKYTISYYNFDK